MPLHRVAHFRSRSTMKFLEYSHLAPRTAYLALASVILTGAAAAQQGDIFVDIVVGNDANPGISWGTPVRTIGEGLSRAAQSPFVNEVWVKAYANQTHFVPSTSLGRNESFAIGSGDALRGGFLGTESTLDDRPTNLFDSTILSGDIGMTPNDPSDDAYHVVTLAPGGLVTLDGFRIVSGNADGTADDGTGGGISTEDSSSGYPNTALRNLTIENCHANERGGGVFLFGVSGILARVVCRNNTCLRQVGPGVFTGAGGGMATLQSGPGFYVFNSVFDGNRSILGGGLHQDSPNSTTGIGFQNCVWTDNIAQSGGGIYFADATGTELTHCTIAYNIVGTTVGSAGGAGIRVAGGATGTGALQIQSSIVYRNRGTFYSPGSPPMQNPSAVETDNNNWLVANSSCIQVSLFSGLPGGAPAPPSWLGATSITIDPVFTNGPTRDFTLAALSPCLDAANDMHLLDDLADLDGDSITNEPVPLDIGELTREVDSPVANTGIDGGQITGAITDMGAHERQ